MKLTPRREKLRNDAHAKLKKQARSMQRDATALTGGALETGSIVQYNLANFDLAKVDKKVLTCVVVDVRTFKSGNACTYKIATKHGVLDKWIHHSYLTPKPGLTRKQMDLDKAYAKWRGMPSLPQRSLAIFASIVGGQGMGKKSCGCKGKCNTRTCSCFKAGRHCGSSCHGGKTNKNCLNCPESVNLFLPAGVEPVVGPPGNKDDVAIV